MAMGTKGTARDMVLSLAVIMVPVVIIWGLLTWTPDEPEVPTVNLAPALTTARAEAPYPVLAPSALPDGWRATSVRWARTGQPWTRDTRAAGNWWQVGYLSPNQIQYSLNQRDGDPAGWLGSLTREGVAEGRLSVVSRDWERWVSRDGRTRSLVRRDPAATVVLVADTGYEALAAFAGTLTSR